MNKQPPKPYTLIAGDVVAALSALPDGKAHGCLCDPPYELGFMDKTWDQQGVSFAPKTWGHLARCLQPGAHLLAFGGTRTYHRIATAIEDGGLEIRDCLMWMFATGFPKSKSLLKPAYEPITLARKPGPLQPLNIDGCRIGTDTMHLTKSTGEPLGQWSVAMSGGAYARVGAGTATGRYPANVMLDEEAGAELDQQSGNRKGMSGGGKHRPDYSGGMFGGIDSTKPYNDNGGASRFYFCPKVSKKERDGSPHPCLKPLALTEYLARLILPPPSAQPRVLIVPFSGTGSEMLGGLRAGWDHVIGIERDPAYIEIAEKRLQAWVTERAA
jgi:DNA modification methylase